MELPLRIPVLCTEGNGASCSSHSRASHAKSHVLAGWSRTHVSPETIAVVFKYAVACDLWASVRATLGVMLAIVLLASFSSCSHGEENGLHAWLQCERHVSGQSDVGGACCTRKETRPLACQQGGIRHSSPYLISTQEISPRKGQSTPSRTLEVLMKFLTPKQLLEQHHFLREFKGSRCGVFGPVTGATRTIFSVE